MSLTGAVYVRRMGQPSHTRNGLESTTMTTPPEPEGRPSEGVNLDKEPSAAPGEDQAPSDAPFDPYRFGKPEHPIPAEYAPPGYTGPTLPPPSPYGPPAGGPYVPPTGSPYPGPPYPGPPQQPYPPYGAPYGPGAPPPPAYHGYAQPRTGNGRAIAGMVLGILAIVLCWLTFFDAVFVVLGLIFSLLALGDSKRTGRNRGMAVTGIICSIVGAVLATVLTVVIFHAADKCGGFSNSNEPGWNQCVRDNF